MSDVIARAAPGFRPKVAVVLGSGLGGLAADVKTIATIPYGELQGFPQTTVGSHAGQSKTKGVRPTTCARGSVIHESAAGR